MSIPLVNTWIKRVYTTGHYVDETSVCASCHYTPGYYGLCGSSVDDDDGGDDDDDDGDDDGDDDDDCYYG